jgi:hypothetical protein
MRGGFSLIDTGSKWRAASSGFSVLPCLQSWHRQQAPIPKPCFFQAQTARPTSSAICSRPRHQALTRRRDAASARRSVFVERKCDLHARSQPPRCDAAGLSKRHMMCGNYWAEHGYLACCRTVLGPAAMPKVLAATPMTTPRRRQREHAASAQRPRARSIICVPQRCRSQSHLPAGLVQWRQHHARAAKTRAIAPRSHSIPAAVRHGCSALRCRPHSQSPCVSPPGTRMSRENSALTSRPRSRGAGARIDVVTCQDAPMISTTHPSAGNPSQPIMRR